MPSTGRADFAVIFGDVYRRRTIMLCVFHVFQTVGYYGFGTLVPTVLAAKGYSIVTSLTFTSLTFIGYPVGSALSLPVVERVDRRWLIVASALLMSVFGLALGYASSATVIVGDGIPLHGGQQLLFERAAHFPGRDLPDLRESDGSRHRLRIEPAVERGHAVRSAATCWSGGGPPRCSR